MDGTLNTLDQKLVAGFDKLDTKVDGLADLFIDLQANNQERSAKLADSLRTLTERLGTPAESNPPFSPQTRRQQQVQSPSRGVVAINLLFQALLMLLGATEWPPSTI
jgi:hypothetical protein